MTRKLLTQGQFAKLVHVRQPSISEAVNKGKLHANRNGLLDPDNPQNRSYLERHPYQRRKPGRRAESTKKQKSQATHRKNARRGKLHRTLHTSAKGAESYTEAERRDKVASANLKEQKLAIQRGNLLERTSVKMVFSRVYQILNSQIKNLGEKLGPDVAAAFGLAEDAVPRVQEIMSIDILRALSGIKRDIQEYLDSVEEGAASDSTEARKKPRKRLRKRKGVAHGKPRAPAPEKGKE